MGPLVIVEGWATGVSVALATGFDVIAAMGSSNLLAIAKAAQSINRHRRIIIAGDRGNGEADAHEAARAIDATVAFPPAGSPGSDFNDLAKASESEAVRDAIENAAPWDIKVIEAALKAKTKAQAQAQPAPAASIHRRTIQITSNLHEVADGAETALISAGAEMYQYGDALVYPIVEEVDAAHGRKTKSARLRAIEKYYLQDQLSRYIIFEKFDARTGKWIKTTAPLNIAMTILARVGKWKFKAILGVITTQTLRPHDHRSGGI
jgi:hypothetical protein